MKSKNYFVAVVLMLSVIACNDDDSTETSGEVTSEEAADMVATSLAEQYSGLTVSIDDVTTTTTEALSSGRSASCGFAKDIDISKSSASGALITFDYEYSYSYQSSCNELNELIAVNSNASFIGSFDAPRLASSNTGLSVLDVTALDQTAVEYEINGSYSRIGMFESRIRNKNTSNSTVEFELNSVTVNKDNTEITGGDATVSITGEVPGKGGFLFEGYIVFEGNGIAKLELQGVSYSINLQTGEVTLL